MGGMAEARGAKRKAREDVNAIQADVGSFAARLGLPAAAARGFSSGFDDSDFRKKGRIGGVADSQTDADDRGGSGVRSEKDKRKKKLVNHATGKIRSSSTDRDSEKRGERPRNQTVGKDSHKGPGKKRRSDGHQNDAQGNKVQVSQKSKIHEVLDGALAEIPKGNRVGRHSIQKQQAQFSNGIALEPTVQMESDQKLRVEAQQLMEKAVHKYERSRYKDSDTNWLMKARRSGTSTDKVAAMTVMLQDNPKANLRTLDALIGMLTSKAGKRHAATGIDALKELFIFSLLPDRKLKYFSQQPTETLSESKDRASALIEWYWEDCLKRRYETFVLALEESTKDALYFLKEKALKTVFELLKSKPEQERRLLSTLVNKLGDPERKMASNASYLLSCLLTAHPNMKEVVVGDVEAFVFRPHVGLRARYYAAIFLNQIVLSNKGNGPALAKQLVQLYLTLFKVVTSVVDDGNLERKGKKGIDWKKSERKEKPEESHQGRGQEQSADFTIEIDSRILSALLTGINRALPFVRAEDLDNLTQENNVLFRMVHSSNFNLAVQALMLLHQLLTRSQAVSDRFYRALYSVLLSKGLAKSSKAEMFLGLFFKALRTDVDCRRMAAFAKRLMQVSLHLPPQFACGSLLLLSEVLKTKPNLWNTVLQTEDQDEEERFTDVRDEEDVRSADESAKDVSVSTVAKGDEWPKQGSYDPKHRDPLYCNAHRACWWELAALACHVHPSVAVMARTLLSGANIVYNGDPLRDLSPGVFLDRFTEKKPKSLRERQPGTWHGSSLTPPSRMVEGAVARPVGEEFLLLAEDQVAPEDLVFHRFYVAKMAQAKHTKTKMKRKDLDEDDLTDGLLGDDAFTGDDSEDDEEVEALIEKEADLEMSESDLSGEDAVESDDDDISLDEENGGSGSEVDDFDVSDDDGAGSMSSSDDENADGSGGMRAEKSTLIKGREEEVKRSRRAKELGAATRREKRVDRKAKKKTNSSSKRAARAGTSNMRDSTVTRKVSSVFQEAPDDSEDDYKADN